MSMIIISMHLNQFVITFTNNEKFELQTIINSFKVQQKDTKSIEKVSNIKQDLEFKNSIINFIKSKKTDLQEKSRGIDRLKQFLIEEKCIHFQQNNLRRSLGIDQIALGLQNLRLKMAQNMRNHEVFQLFVAFLQEMKDLRQDRIYQFQYKLSKATKLSRMERETLALIAKKIVKVDSLSKMNDVEDDISAFFSKIIRYGIHQQFKELQRINSQQIKNKCFKLLQYLQNNCIEMKQQFNPVRSLLKKLSISIYDKSDILSNLTELPQNIRLIFQPVCTQIFRLRQSSTKTSFIADTGLSYVSHDMKKAQEQNLEALRKERDDLKKKCASVEEEQKRTKFILEKLGHMSNLFQQENLYDTIQNELVNSSEQIKIYLQRIFEHLKSFEQLTLGARKASFIERKDNQIQFLQQKLSAALQELDVLKSSKFTIEEAESMLIDQNSELKNQTSQNQRIISQFQTQMTNLNAQINNYSKQITKLEGELIESEKQFQLSLKEIAQLRKQIDHLMNIKKEEEEKQKQNQINIINKSLQSQLKTLKQENASLLQKCQERSAQHNILQEKMKQLDSLKGIGLENLRLIQLIDRLNKQIQASKQPIEKPIKSIETTEQQIQTSSQQQKTTEEIAQMMAEIKQLKEEKAKFDGIQAENDELKQERVFRLNQQKEMKRIYRQQKADISQMQNQLAEYKQMYEKIVRDHEILKKKHNQIRLEIFERKVHANNKTSQGTDLENQNLKKMQEKHRLLERNFEQIKKYNELIKTQYYKLKQETNHIIKSKVKEVLEEFKQNQIKLKKQVEQLTHKNIELTAKITILQQQNLNLKVQFHAKSKHDDLDRIKQKPEYLSQSLNFAQHREVSQSKQKLRAELRNTKIKNEQDRINMLNLIRTKEEEISSQRIQILKLEQKLDQALAHIAPQSSISIHNNGNLIESIGAKMKDKFVYDKK